VRVGAKNVAPAMEGVLAISLRDCRVVIEAGDLKRNAPLRVVCERAANAQAIGCYADNDRELTRLIDDEMRTAGLTITPDARAALVPLLGGDRRASLSEIRKLALYSHGQDTVAIDDILAIVADASTLALDRLIDAAFAGRHADVEAEFAKTQTAGTAPGTILITALRQVAVLHRARAAMDAGGSLDFVLSDARPPIHFSRKPLVEAALKAWTSARLERAMEQLADTTFEARRQARLAESLAQRALLAIASAARRKA
jgi:DNA polymerase III subunit delta